MTSILNDPTKFFKLNDVKDINMKVEKLLTNSLEEIKDRRVFTSIIHDSLEPTALHTLQFCGSPKVHKSGPPLRPVLDVYNSPYHKT